MMNTTIPTSAPTTEALSSEETYETTTNAPQTGGRGRAGGARRFIVILFLMALGVATGRAQSTVSVTASPLQLSEKIVQLTGELKLIDVVSVAGTAGVGTRDGETITLGGGQIRVYLMGGFDGGMHIGAEALYSEFGKASSIEGIVNLMNGVSAAPLVGYKHVFPFGLTLDIQGGIRFGEGEIRTTGDGAESRDVRGDLLANLNVGWSF